VQLLFVEREVARHQALMEATPQRERVFGVGGDSQRLLMWDCRQDQEVCVRCGGRARTLEDGRRPNRWAVAAVSFG